MRIKFKLKKLFDKFIFRIWGLSNASNRKEFIIDWLASLQSNSKILDAGAGIQKYKKFAKHLDYVSQDFGEYLGGDEFGSKYHQKWNAKSCDIICDITTIPRDDCSFDYIMCTEVFEHLNNPMEALRELSRLLKNGGELLITAPFRCVYHQTPYFFYSGFSKYWYKHFAKEYGLTVKKIIPNGSYFEDLAQEVFRTISFGNFIQNIFGAIFSIPYLFYLFLSEKIINTKSPESCWGYHVILKKNNKVKN